MMALQGLSMKQHILIKHKDIHVSTLYSKWDWAIVISMNSLTAFAENSDTVGSPEVGGGREEESEVCERRPEDRQGHQPWHLR